ncbi:hypothetical protein VHEMI06953 [[Torrubiella] hemipterigena]|uniref:RNAse P Rpr2/Rpp21 subunit domain-containing protein n=1 Tax=[Torrubiella] hemipterigena TaxID=1531966 RepID=A0A0A1TKS5_9HYPO|nr:hypothetical protein VHEMI06953 [[Torrubiella] hemipterigena]
MAKSKSAPGVQNRHVYSRASYLYQAAAYLASQAGDHNQPSENAPTTVSAGKQTSNASDVAKAVQNTSRLLLKDMREVSLKVLIRQTPELKRTICRSCDTLLREGDTCTSIIENLSKRGEKSWADILVVSCHMCKAVKRYPLNAKRPERKKLRLVAGNHEDNGPGG